MNPAGNVTALRRILSLGVVLATAASVVLAGRPALAQTCCSPAPQVVYGYDSQSGQVDILPAQSAGYISVSAPQSITTVSAPQSITVGPSQPVSTDVPTTETTTTTYPATTTAPTTTYVEENTTIPPPNIDGIPYAVAGSQQWVSPGGFYCTQPGGAQVWVPSGASSWYTGC